MSKQKAKVPAPKKVDPDIADLKARLDKQSQHYALINLTTGEGFGARLDEAVPPASVTKWFTTAAIMNAKGDHFDEFLNTPAPTEKRMVGRGKNKHVVTVKTGPSNAEMFARFLARSDNNMGPKLAERAFGHEGPATVQAFYDLKEKLGLDSWNIKDQLGIRNFTTGLNDDGQGPLASPRDIAKVAKYLYDHDGGKFLKRFANPNGSGIGHTMADYAFNHPGIEVIGCKSGTNPGARDVTAACVFKNTKTGDIYAGFMHTDTKNKRPDLLAALETLGQKFDETKKRVGDGLKQFGDDLVAAPKKIAAAVLQPFKAEASNTPPRPPQAIPAQTAHTISAPVTSDTAPRPAPATDAKASTAPQPLPQAASGARNYGGLGAPVLKHYGLNAEDFVHTEKAMLGDRQWQHLLRNRRDVARAEKFMHDALGEESKGLHGRELATEFKGWAKKKQEALGFKPDAVEAKKRADGWFGTGTAEELRKKQLEIGHPKYAAAQ